MNPKPIKWKTNFNNKLFSDHFVHVDLAPKGTIPESKLPIIYQINTEDGSAPEVKVALIDFVRYKLKDLIGIETFPSHGMDPFDFIQYFKTIHPEANAETELASYIFKKV